MKTALIVLLSIDQQVDTHLASGVKVYECLASLWGETYIKLSRDLDALQDAAGMQDEVSTFT